MDAQERRNDLIGFFGWVQENTDLFDPVMVQMVLDHNDPLRLDPTAVADLVDQYLTRPTPEPVS